MVQVSQEVGLGGGFGTTPESQALCEFLAVVVFVRPVRCCVGTCGRHMTVVMHRGVRQLECPKAW